jgi:hypothetical protein
MQAPSILALWRKSSAQLNAQLNQRTPQAVFLEGSIAEGFGNERSDVDFVAIIDDGTEVATMPYILFVDGRRVEIRLLSYQRLSRELQTVGAAVSNKLDGLSSALSWNMLERCQRFMGCMPIENHQYINQLKNLLGEQAFTDAVVTWFADFSRQSARYAVAMYALGQPECAWAYIKTAVFHGAKSYVARSGERYLGSKWLSLQMQRSGMDAQLNERFWRFYYAKPIGLTSLDYLHMGLELLERFRIDNVSFEPGKVLLQQPEKVTTWQIGSRVHVLRDQDVFRLSANAALHWRAIVWGTSCQALCNNALNNQLNNIRKQMLAEFARLSLVSLFWGENEAIRAGQHSQAAPGYIAKLPLLGVNGAMSRSDREENGRSPPSSLLVKTQFEPDMDIELLPLPARRFAEAGVNLTWANIGVENSREDALGALKKQQWRVFEYTTQRMVQAASMIALAAFGITPQPPLEEAVLTAQRLLPLDSDLNDKIRNLECQNVDNTAQAMVQLALADDIVLCFRTIARDESFPASFDSAAGWCDTIIYGYDWINLATFLDAPFPASAVGGRGTAEEARDLLASNYG